MTNTGDTDIDQILENYGAFVAGADLGDLLTKDEAKAAITKKLTEIEKAYGGCRNCYGKGCASARVGTSSRYGNATHDTIKYCICERGKQLEALTGKKLNEARIDELQGLLNQSIKVAYKTKEWAIPKDILADRIKALQATKEKLG